MTDIKTKDDIKILVDAFYNKVLKDEEIGFIFTETIAFIWEKHIPTMYDFWDTMLFNTAAYKGNPMLKHIALNKKIELTSKRFNAWLKLWESIVNDNFKGEIADKAKAKATMIGRLMQYKIANSNNI